MARLLGPDMGSRAVYLPSGAPAAGRTGIVYADAAGTVLADILTYDGTQTPGAPITGSIVTVDAFGLLPLFWYPDGLDRVWITVNGGPVTPIDADYNQRIDALGGVVNLPSSNGVDDTTAINAVLAANAGKRVRGRAGSAYLISTPLVVYSGTELDMTSCTVTLLAGSNCNMLQNRAVSQARRVLDAVTTATSTTLTSATAAFTAADVGKAVTVQAAGTAGLPLTTTIQAVTDATTVTLAAPAGTTVTGQYAAIGPRDSDITVVGGRWDRGSNGSVPAASVDAHSLRFRHVDRLTVRDLTCVSAQGGGGKYQINPGDCTDVTVRDIGLPTVGSDGVHFNGPCRQIIVRNIIGDVLDDDLVSFTARDTFVPVTDCAGDITDVVVDGCMYRSSGLATSSAVKIVAGMNTTQTSEYVCRNFRIRGLTGPAEQGVVTVGDNVPVGGNGGRFEDITIDGVRSLGGVKPGVYLRVGIMDRISVRNVDIDGAEIAAVRVDATVGRLQVSDLHWSPTGATYGVYVNAGTVDTLIVSRVQGFTPAAAVLLRLESTAVIGRLIMSQIDVTAAAASASLIDYVTSASSIVKVSLTDLTLHNINYPLGSYRSNVTVTASGVIATGMTAWTRARDASVVTVAGAQGLSGDVDFILPDTGEVITRSWSSNVLDAPPDAMTSGEEALPRLLSAGNPQLATGLLILTYFTARKTETVPNAVTITRDTAGVGTTLARIGIYSVAGNGDLTLVASTLTDTALWSATFTRYNKALSAAFAKVAGRRYAVAQLWVGSGTAPRLSGVSPVNGFEAQRAPVLNGSLTGQADLPASITAAQVGNTAGISVYASLI